MSKYPSQLLSEQEKGKAFGNASVVCSVYLATVTRELPEEPRT